MNLSNTWSSMSRRLKQIAAGALIPLGVLGDLDFLLTISDRSSGLGRMLIWIIAHRDYLQPICIIAGICGVLWQERQIRIEEFKKKFEELNEIIADLKQYSWVTQNVYTILGTDIPNINLNLKNINEQMNYVEARLEKLGFTTGNPVK